MGESQDSQQCHFCAPSNAWFYLFQVHLLDLKLSLQWCQCSSLRFLRLPYFLSTEPVTSTSFQYLAWQEITAIFFKNTTLIFFQNFYQNLSSLVKTLLIFRVIKKKTLQHYCRKLADWTLPYWKIWFPSTNYKIFESQELLGKFCWDLQNSFQRSAS